MDSLNYAFEGRGPFFADDDFITRRNVGFIGPDFAVDLSKKPIFAGRFLGSSAEASDQINNGSSSSGDMAPAKRVRIADSKSQTPYCQVSGCNKDLSSAKDYHRRHRVCDVHSKTAVVVVNGMQQRFCQQCSRFHLLGEFDEGKRSCRKRLAGHNERRRKPQFDAHLFGSTFGSDLSKASLLLSGFLPSRFLGSELLRGPMKDNTMGIKSEHDEQAQERLSAGSISSCALSLLSAHQLANRPLVFRQAQSLRKSRIKRGLEKSRTVDLFDREGFPQISNEGHFAPREGGNTVDLAGLSLHLQRIEQQKHCDAQAQMQGIL